MEKLRADTLLTIVVCYEREKGAYAVDIWAFNVAQALFIDGTSGKSEAYILCAPRALAWVPSGVYYVNAVHSVTSLNDSRALAQEDGVRFLHRNSNLVPVPGVPRDHGPLDAYGKQVVEPQSLTLPARASPWAKTAQAIIIAMLARAIGVVVWEDDNGQQRRTIIPSPVFRTKHQASFVLVDLRLCDIVPSRCSVTPLVADVLVSNTAHETAHYSVTVSSNPRAERTKTSIVSFQDESRSTTETALSLWSTAASALTWAPCARDSDEWLALVKFWAAVCWHRRSTPIPDRSGLDERWADSCFVQKAKVIDYNEMPEAIARHAAGTGGGNTQIMLICLRAASMPNLSDCTVESASLADDEQKDDPHVYQLRVLGGTSVPLSSDRSSGFGSSSRLNANNLATWDERGDAGGPPVPQGQPVSQDEPAPPQVAVCAVHRLDVGMDSISNVSSVMPTKIGGQAHTKVTGFLGQILSSDRDHWTVHPSARQNEGQTLVHRKMAGLSSSHQLTGGPLPDMSHNLRTVDTLRFTPSMSAASAQLIYSRYLGLHWHRDMSMPLGVPLSMNAPVKGHFLAMRPTVAARMSMLTQGPVIEHAHALEWRPVYIAYDDEAMFELNPEAVKFELKAATIRDCVRCASRLPGWLEGLDILQMTDPVATAMIHLAVCQAVSEADKRSEDTDPMDTVVPDPARGMGTYGLNAVYKR